MLRWPPDPTKDPGNGLLYCDGFICSNSHGAGPSVMADVMRNTLTMASITDGTSNTFAVGEAIPAWSEWSWWYCQNASVATCAIPINNRRGIDQLQTFAGNWDRNFGFYSLHPGGAQFVMIDGSVRFIPDTINTVTYRALATTMGGEAVQNPWLPRGPDARLWRFRKVFDASLVCGVGIGRSNRSRRLQPVEHRLRDGDGDP